MEWRALLICCECGEVWQSGGCYGVRNDEKVKELIKKYLRKGCCFECKTKGKIEILNIEYMLNFIGEERN